MMRRDKIKALTFDVGGTLIDPWPSVGHVYAEVAKQHGVLDADPEVLNRRFAEAWRTQTNFDYSRRAWAELVAQTFAASAIHESDPHLFADLYARFAGTEVWRLYDDVVPALETLHTSGLRLGVISNWDERLRPLLRALKLERYFEVIVVSREFGQHKPAPAIFQHALRQLGLPGKAVLHVGDRASEDVEGAKRAGLQVVRIDRSRPRSTDEVIRSLTDLPLLL